MKVKTFIEKYIQPNNVVRLVRKIPGGHETVGETWSVVDMEWRIAKGDGVFAEHVDSEVMGVTGIMTVEYQEAINIVIK